MSHFQALQTTVGATPAEEDNHDITLLEERAIGITSNT
jgi:hypothetical protein